MALSRLVTSDGFPLSTSDGSPIYVTEPDPPGAEADMTQLPILAACGYATIQPYVEEAGRLWNTPAPRCDD